MNDYTAQDGINLLSYLGVELIPTEIEEFKGKWNQTYIANADLVETTKLIYCQVLPFQLHANWQDALELEAARVYHIDHKLDETMAGKRLHDGEDLETLLFEQSWELASEPRK